MVRLVVQDDDALHPHEFGYGAGEHLPFGLKGGQWVTVSFKEGAVALGQVERLPSLEGVVVGDDDLRLVELAEHVGRHEFAAGVVAVRVVRLKDAQAVADGDARRHDEEAAGEPGARGAADGVHGLPSDQHGHHGGLAGAGGELQGHAGEPWIRCFGRPVNLVQESAPPVADRRRDFGEPDRGLDGLDLAEERADVAELVMPPVLQQACRFRCDAPLLLGQGPPSGEFLPQAADQRDQFVLLVSGSQGGARFVEREILLLRPCFPRRGDRGDERHGAPTVADGIGGLAALVEHPVARGHLVGGVEDRAFVKTRGVGHGRGDIS